MKYSIRHRYKVGRSGWNYTYCDTEVIEIEPHELDNDTINDTIRNRLKYKNYNNYGELFGRNILSITEVGL